MSHCLSPFQNRYQITIPKISCKRDSSYLSAMNCSCSGAHGIDFSVDMLIKPDVIIHNLSVSILNRESIFCFWFIKKNVQFLDKSVRLSSSHEEGQRQNIFGHEQHYNWFVSIFHRNGYIERNEYCCWRFETLLKCLSSVSILGTSSCS